MSGGEGCAALCHHPLRNIPALGAVLVTGQNPAQESCNCTKPPVYNSHNKREKIPCYPWNPVSKYCNIQDNNKKICSSATELLTPLTRLSVPAGFSRVRLQCACFPLGKNTTTNTFLCLTLQLAGLQIVNKQEKNLRMFFTQSPRKETKGKKKLEKQTKTPTLHNDECTKRNLAHIPSHHASSAPFSAI